MSEIQIIVQLRTTLESAQNNRYRRPRCDALNTATPLASLYCSHRGELAPKFARGDPFVILTSLSRNVNVKMVMVCDGRTASPLIGNGHAVLRDDSRTDRDHCARKTRRFCNSHYEVCRRRQHSSRSLSCILSARSLHQTTITQP